MATKQDLKNLETVIRSDLEQKTQAMKSHVDQSENRVIIRLSTIVAGMITLALALVAAATQLL